MKTNVGKLRKMAYQVTWTTTTALAAPQTKIEALWIDYEAEHKAPQKYGKWHKKLPRLLLLIINCGKSGALAL